MTLPKLGGHVIFGGVVSTTVTKKEQVEVAYPRFMAVHTTVVLVPRSNADPETGSHVLEMMARLLDALAE